MGSDERKKIQPRKNNPIKPSGSTIIKENDELYFITSAQNIDSVVNEVQEDHSQHSRIFIVGGGKIGFNLAKDLESDFNVKLVEREHILRLVGSKRTEH